jgi:hypothetical protein
VRLLGVLTGSAGCCGGRLTPVPRLATHARAMAEHLNLVRDGATGTESVGVAKVGIIQPVSTITGGGIPDDCLQREFNAVPIVLDIGGL